MVFPKTRYDYHMKEKKFRRRKRLIKNRKVEMIFHGILLVLLAGAAIYGVLRWRGIAPPLPFEAQEDREEAAPSPGVHELVAPEKNADEETESAEEGLETMSITADVHEPYSSQETVQGAIPDLTDSEIEEMAQKLMSTEDGSVVTTDVDCDWRLILVNPTHRLPEDFTVETALLEKGSDARFDVRAVDALREMIGDCEKEGLSVVVRGSYRTMEQQKELFEAKTEELMKSGMSRSSAEKEAATVVAYPGTSEHQLGLAADIVSGENLDLEENQENTPTQKWLMKNCWKYGFILRYPTSMSHMTGIIYEPWHYRYVGDVAAQMMHEENLCFEEFLAKYGNTVLPEGTGFVAAEEGSGRSDRGSSEEEEDGE